MRDFAFEIYKMLVAAPDKEDPHRHKNKTDSKTESKDKNDTREVCTIVVFI